jgi:hypothetical protein
MNPFPASFRESHSNEVSVASICSQRFRTVLVGQQKGKSQLGKAAAHGRVPFGNSWEK